MHLHLSRNAEKSNIVSAHDQTEALEESKSSPMQAWWKSVRNFGIHIISARDVGLVKDNGELEQV